MEKRVTEKSRIYPEVRKRDWPDEERIQQVGSTTLSVQEMWRNIHYKLKTEGLPLPGEAGASRESWKLCER